MNKSDYIKIKYHWFVALVLPLFFIACEDDDQPVYIDSVWTNQLDVETHQIHSAYTGEWIRVEGSGFTGLSAIYCNGRNVSFVPTYLTDNYMTFQIPSGTPIADEVEEESIRNTIRMVTNHGEGVYKDFVFKDKNKMPAITNISHTLPEPGDVISIEGQFLSGVSEIYFPGPNGDIQATDFSINYSTMIDVVVPEGVGSVSGAIRAVTDDEDIYSPEYMFCYDGIFLQTFAESDVMMPLSGNSANVSIYSGKNEVAVITGAINNPDYMLAIPETIKPLEIATNNDDKAGYFKYYAFNGFKNVINHSEKINGNTALSDLAIQLDVYMTKSWNTGALALRMNKNNRGNGSYCYNIIPWELVEDTENSRKVLLSYPFNDQKWRTVTVPFSVFTGLGFSTLQEYINALESGGVESLLCFVNFDMNGDGHTPYRVQDFQLYIANMRLVINTVPSSY